MPDAELTRGSTERVLAGAHAIVCGAGTAAAALRRHLGALGAVVVDGGDAAPGSAAHVVLHAPDGRRRDLALSWAGPVDRSELADEAAVQAGCGVMHVHGRRAARPRGLTVDYCTATAAVLGVTGLLATLLAGPDDRLTVHSSVAEAALLAVSQYLAGAGADDPEAVDMTPGGPPFVSADGVRFELETLEPRTWAAFWTALGVAPAAIGRGWRPFQFRYATATAALPQELHRALARIGFAEIGEHARATGVHVCRLYGCTEYPGGPPAPWQVDPVAGPAPRPATGLPDQPLKGTVVLEAGRRVQAPLAAHLLRLLGAEIVRIEPHGGDPMRGMPPCIGGLSARWLALNRGKQAEELDIKSTAGRRRLRAMACGADVFLHNWAPGRAEALGLSAPELRCGLVHAHTSGWADAELPDLPPGTDFMVQARTGLAELVGPPGHPPAPSLMTLLDVLGGVLGAEAVMIGLLARAQRGSGMAVRSSLSGAAEELRVTRPAPARAGFRQPEPSEGGWVVQPDRPGAAAVPVVTDLAALLTDPELGEVLDRDEHGCPALSSPWRIA